NPAAADSAAAPGNPAAAAAGRNPAAAAPARADNFRAPVGSARARRARGCSTARSARSTGRARTVGCRAPRERPPARAPPAGSKAKPPSRSPWPIFAGRPDQREEQNRLYTQFWYLSFAERSPFWHVPRSRLRRRDGRQPSSRHHYQTGESAMRKPGQLLQALAIGALLIASRTSSAGGLDPNTRFYV